MDAEYPWFELAEDAELDEVVDPAPARLKSRIYSRLLAEQAATGRLLSVSATRESGQKLCVFEAAIARAPLADRIKSMNPCYVCHARHLAEHLDHAPIFWPHCPYAEFHRR